MSNNETSNASSTESDTLTYEKLAKLMKEFSAKFDVPVVTSRQLKAMPPLSPIHDFAWEPPKAIYVDYLSIVQPTWSPARAVQSKSRTPRQPPSMSAMELEQAESRWVPGVVVKVDGGLCLSTGEHIDEVTEWVNDCCEGRVSRSFTSQNGRIETFRYTFDSEVDKVMFTLRWC